MESKVPFAHCDLCPFVEEALVPDRGRVLPDTPVDILFIGECPGKQEVIQKKPFIGKSGEMLSRVADPLLKGKTFWITNAAVCFDPFAPETKTPVGKAAQCCKDRLINIIHTLKPKVIITLGNVPTQVLLGGKIGITKLRGKLVPFNGSLLMPTYHPAAVLRTIKYFQDFVMDIRRAISCVDTPESTTPEHPDFEVTTDYHKVLREMEEAPFAVLDLETTGLDFTRDHTICYVMATENKVYILPEAVSSMQGFREALGNCKAKWSGHNAKFDRNFMLYELGVPVHFSFDTMLAHYLLDERGGVHGLKEVCASMFGAPDWEAELQTHLKLNDTKNYDEIPKEILYLYASLDGYWTAKLTRKLSKIIQHYPKLLKVMLDIMIPASEAFSNAEVRGVMFDIESQQELLPVYADKAVELEAKLISIAGITFNPRSPVQTSNVLYRVCGVPPVEGMETSTDTKNVLIKRRGYPIVDTLIEYRAVNTLLSRYVVGLAEKVGADGRIHTSYLLHGTTTGRLSSSPNLQNLPRTAKDIKGLLTASPGCSLLYADYSQLELRCIAWLTDDEFLLDCYRRGIDLHGAMAEVLFGKDYTPDQRSLAKRLNFGLVYGRSVSAIANDGLVEMTQVEAQRIQTIFFERMPRVTAWMMEVKDLVHARHYVESPLGRRRRFPIIPGDRSGVQEIYRQAINMIPQSMASDMTTCAFIKMDREGLNPLISVHDSITCEMEDSVAQDAHTRMIEIMQETGKELYGDKVPFTASGGIGKNWGKVE